MNEFYRWISTIIVSVIFVDFIEILMPSNSMKRYIRMILGLLVMVVILQPILGMLKKDFSLQSSSFKFENQLEGISAKKQEEAFSSSQEDAVVAQYKQNLESRMAGQIKSMAGGKEVKVKADVVEDTKSENFGQIKSITVYLSSGTKTVSKVQKVEIGGSDEGSKTAETGEASGSFSDLKGNIASMYGIDGDRISIVYDKSE